MSAGQRPVYGLTQLEATISSEDYRRDIWVAESSHNKFSRVSVKAAERPLFEPSPRANSSMDITRLYLKDSLRSGARDSMQKIHLKRRQPRAKSAEDGWKAPVQHCFHLWANGSKRDPIGRFWRLLLSGGWLAELYCSSLVSVAREEGKVQAL